MASSPGARPRLVLFAALVHAGWNSWLKITGDRLAALATISIGWTAVGGFAAVALGAPEPAVWPYLGASTIVHTLYAMALIRSYRDGDLSVVYPVARGVGPLVFALVSSAFLGEALGTIGALGVVLIVAGVLWLGFPRATLGYASVLFSVATGILIASYTLLDGLGGRVALSPHQFAAWLFLLTALPLLIIAPAVHRARIVSMVRPMLSKGIAVGILSATAYWIVIWAMSQAHLGLVAALRETSVVFAAAIGAFALRECVRWYGIVLVFLGVAATKFA